MAAALALVLVLSMGGCAKEEESTGDGVFDVAFSNSITSLTPFVTNTGFGGRASIISRVIFESLGYVNYDKELTPWVAESWSTEDNLTYTVKIHENVYDSAGNHITADDIVWFIDEAVAAALKPVFNKLVSWEKVDEYTFSMTIRDNIVGVFEYLMEDIYVVSKAAFEASPDQFGTACVSTSQYKVTEFTPNSDFAMELRDDYWGDVSSLDREIQYQVEKVKFHAITEASQISAAFATGLVDYMDEAPMAVAQEMFTKTDEYTILEYEGHQGFELFFSGYVNDGTGEKPTSPVANDVYLRQAICYAINNQAMIDGYAQGHASLMYDVCPSFYKGYQESWESEEYYPYSVEKAKECLEKSDYNGESLVILSYQSYNRISEIIVNDLKAVGINAEIYSPEAAQWMQIRLDGSYYDMVLVSIGGTYLPDHWSIRYDPAAYANGDATSRHDYVLAELLYKTWTVEGFTAENINEVHNYIKDNAIAYGYMNMNNFCVYSNALTLEEEIVGFTHRCYPFSSKWKGI